MSSGGREGGKLGALPRLSSAWVGTAVAANRDRWPCAVPVALALGIGTYFLLHDEPDWWLGPLVLMLGLAAVYAAANWRQAAFPAALFLALAALGFTAAGLRTQVVDGGLLQRSVQAATVEGRILDLQPYPQGSRVVLDHLRIAGVAAPDTPAHARIRIRADEPPLAAGQWVRVRASLSPPSPPVQPGGFDFQRHAFFTGIGAVGFALGRAEVLPALAPGPFDLAVHLANLRLRLAQRVAAQIPGEAGAVAAALIVGHRTLISEKTLDAFRDSGLAHLLAISGLHVGLAAGIVFFALRALMTLWPPLALRLPVKKLAAAGALVAAFLYALMAGATVPTQRAVLVCAVVLIAVMVDRRGLSLRMLAWAATAVLLLQPESLLGPSFQMSFAAALALVAGYEAALEKGWLRPGGSDASFGRGVLLYGAGVAFTTVIASAATAPFVLYHFNNVAKFGLLANLVAVPVTALWVMPAAMLSFLLLPFGLEGLALIPMGWGTDLVIAVAERVAGLPAATEILVAPPAWALAAMAAGGVWLCVVRGRVRFAGLAALGIGALAATQMAPADLVISGDGRLAAVRLDQGGYAFSTLRRGRFEREGWLAHAGFRDDQAVPWRRDGSETGSLRCDGEGCVLTRHGRRVVIAEGPAALAEDCGRADLVVALVPAGRRCRQAGPVIDFFDLWRKGAHAVHVTAKGIRVEAVNDTRGNRPWVLRPRGRQERDAD